jgi:hypothetical protein
MYMAVLKLAGGPITIKCSKHDFVLNITPYFEYVAMMSVAVQTNDWFRNIITEIGGSLMKMIGHSPAVVGARQLCSLAQSVTCPWLWGGRGRG